MKTKVPLMLIEGKEEDEGEEYEEEESEEEKVPLKKKGKVTITKPIVFSQRTSRKKSRKEEEQVFLKKPPPTLQERMKSMEEGASVVNFKILKYEIRTAEEKKQIEDMVMSKMGKWKYSPKQFTNQVPECLMKII